MLEYRTAAEIEAMRPAGEFVAATLATLAAEVRVGDNLLDIDARAHELVKERGAQSCYLDYHPSFGGSKFGHVICLSVNDAVLHGRPRNQVLQDGDLLCLDFAVSVDGWVADSARSIIVGTPREEDQRLIATTEEALCRAIDKARVGNKLGDISAAIGEYSRSQGYSVNTQFGGHGVGRTMHGEPHVPNDGRPGRGLKLRPGLVIAIEPWLMATTHEIYTDPEDTWTLRSKDGSRGAHSEHTVAITEEGPIVLTARPDGV